MPLVAYHLPLANSIFILGYLILTLYLIVKEPSAHLPAENDHPEMILHRLHREVVENTGIEPVTSWLQTRRSPS